MKIEQNIKQSASQLESVLASAKKHVAENGDPFGIAEASYKELESLLHKAGMLIRELTSDYSTSIQ